MRTFLQNKAAVDDLLEHFIIELILVHDFQTYFCLPGWQIVHCRRLHQLIIPDLIIPTALEEYSDMRHSYISL